MSINEFYIEAVHTKKVFIKHFHESSAAFYFINKNCAVEECLSIDRSSVKKKNNNNNNARKYVENLIS